MNIILFMDQRFRFLIASIGLLLVTFTGLADAQTVTPFPAEATKAAVNPRVTANQRSSILVRIDPRIPSGGSGSARVLLLNGRGEVLSAAPATASYDGLGKGINGPKRDVRYGDTPFGVYRYVKPQGGTADSRISPAFGTGKLYLDDSDMFGEVKDAGRGTIRLHGGGSSLPDPYKLDQRLVSTQGCVRMKNRDVNTLIQLIKALPREEALEFIFMGSDAYLRGLATDTTLSDKPWWDVLRTALGIPPSPPAEMILAGWARPSLDRYFTAFQADAQLIELIKVFAEDSGPRGRSAFEQLRTRADSLPQLRDSVPGDDPLRPMIAFALCYAGRDCEANIAVIESAFNKPAPFKGFYPDEAQEMLNRLIDQANQQGRPDQVKNLLKKLIAQAPEADGALAEGLGVTLSVKLRDQTTSFIAALDELAGPSRTTRESVLALIESAEYLSRSEFTNISRRIERTVNASPNTKSVFTEFEKAYRRPEQEDRNRQRF